MDKQRQLPDNNADGKDVVGGIHIELPINRNLSQQLFGQLKTLVEESTWYLEIGPGLSPC